MSEIEKLQKFVAKFFENLKCDLSWDGKTLTVSKVPEKFEKFLNKKSPYYLVFESQYRSDKNKLIAPGCSTLNAMKRFLQNTGTTTLLKLDFQSDPVELIKKSLEFKNCEITDLKKSVENNFFYRFTVQANFHYLNEREQMLNEIYVHNNEIVQGDLSGYPVLEGKKEDVSAGEIEKNYNLAKTEIQKLTKEKINQISQTLANRLETETQRIKSHFEQLKREINEKISTESEKLGFFKNQLNTCPENEKQEILKKIQRIENLIEKVKEDNDFYKLEKEETFTLDDEKHKHSLSIDNKLINTTVIYYPIFSFALFFDNIFKKQIKVIYNPLTQSVEPINCLKCEKEIKEIEICNEGHILCSECSRVCKDCGKTFCENCLKHSCNICQRELCKDCITQCPKCKKYFCKMHMRKDNITEEQGCANCLKTCPKCRTCSEPQYFKINSEGTNVCQKCANKEISNKITEGLQID